MDSPPEPEKVTCAFCGDSVLFNADDPIALGVVEHWRPHDEQIDWMVYSHRNCFLSRLTSEVRELIDL